MLTAESNGHLNVPVAQRTDFIAEIAQFSALPFMELPDELRIEKLPLENPPELKIRPLPESWRAQRKLSDVQTRSWTEA